MKVLVTLEERLWRGAGGGIYAQNPGAVFLCSELLETFDRVVLVARVQDGTGGQCPANYRIDAPSVSICELPGYSGPWQYLLKMPALRRRIRQAVAGTDARLLQMPGLVAYLVWRELKRVQGPFGLELMGDPWDALGPGTTKDMFRPIYRRIAARKTRLMCAEAGAVLYWSRRMLQQRYPCAAGAHTAVAPRIVLSCGYASAEAMKDRVDRTHKLRFSGDAGPLPTLGFIGSFAQLYKGPDILLRAIATCRKRGLQLRVRFVGEGRYREAMERLARELSLGGSVTFLGPLDFGKPVFDFLDSVDLFVMPSRAEGLPRALVEAMARGCPCIGAEVGGIAELLAREDLFRAGDPQSLSAKILEVTAGAERLLEMSLRNIQRAKEFDPEVLRKTRLDFYRLLQLPVRGAADGRAVRCL